PGDTSSRPPSRPGLTHEPGMSGCSGKGRRASVVQTNWPGIGPLLYHRPSGSLDLFRDVHTMTVRPEMTSTAPAHDPASILDHFAELDDPRREQGRIHRLDEIIFIATWAVF